MRVDEFIAIMIKVKNFKLKLEKHGINETHQNLITKIYIEDLTTKINTNLLKVV